MAGSPDRQTFLDARTVEWRDTGVFDGVRRFAVAFSGGPDSTALLLAARDLVPDLLDCALHVDHAMHEDSAVAAAAAESIARDLDVPVVTVAVTPTPDGHGREDAARRVREAAYRRVAQERGLDAVATGHTADDQAETMLLALLRGAGTDGASAMPIRRPLGDAGAALLRPLLHARRDAAAAFCAANGIVPLIDPTNADMTLLRNRVRAELLPMLESLRPGATARLAGASELFAADRTVLDALAHDVVDRVVRRVPDGEPGVVAFDRTALASLPYAIASRVVRRVMAPFCGGVPPRRAAVEAVLEGRGGTLPGTALDCRVGSNVVTLLPHDPGR